MATESFRVGGDRAAIPDVNVDPFAVAALCAAIALADLSGDVDLVDFVKKFPAEHRQAVGLMSSMFYLGMSCTSQVIVGKISRA